MIYISELNWGFYEILFLIIIFAIGFSLTLIIIPYIIKLMKKKGFIGFDIHKNTRPEVAESGGLSILIGFSIASIFLIFFFPQFFNEILIFLLTVLLAGAIGFIDDVIKLRSRYKMILIIFAGSLIFITNYIGFIHIESPTIPILGKMRLTIIYPLVAPLIVAVFANTVNMLEGYNGEGTGTCLIAVLFIFICGLILNSAIAILFCTITIAVLIPFFIYNKYPARIFPGDIGTLSIGAMIACIALFGSLEAVVFSALLIHIFNSFYVLYSVRGFFESSKILENRSDTILLENDQIMASDQKKAALSLPRLILAKGPLSEPQLVKNFFVISIICGFLSIITALLIAWTIGTISFPIVIIIIISFIVPIILLMYYFPRIRGVVVLMFILFISGIVLMFIIKTIIMPASLPHIKLIWIEIPLNLVVVFLIVVSGLGLWYLISIQYFWIEIKKMKSLKDKKSNK